MPKNHVYTPLLCIHGHNEITCPKCRAEHEAWLQDREDYTNECRDQVGED